MLICDECGKEITSRIYWTKYWEGKKCRFCNECTARHVDPDRPDGGYSGYLIQINRDAAWPAKSGQEAKR